MLSVIKGYEDRVIAIYLDKRFPGESRETGLDHYIVIKDLTEEEGQLIDNRSYDEFNSVKEDADFFTPVSLNRFQGWTKLQEDLVKVYESKYWLEV